MTTLEQHLVFNVINVVIIFKRFYFDSVLTGDQHQYSQIELKIHPLGMIYRRECVLSDLNNVIFCKYGQVQLSL